MQTVLSRDMLDAPGPSTCLTPAAVGWPSRDVCGRRGVGRAGNGAGGSVYCGAAVSGGADGRSPGRGSPTWLPGWGVPSERAQTGSLPIGMSVWLAWTRSQSGRRRVRGRPGRRSRRRCVRCVGSIRRGAGRIACCSRSSQADGCWPVGCQRGAVSLWRNRVGPQSGGHQADSCA
jgi:hypothetical protein